MGKLRLKKSIAKFLVFSIVICLFNGITLNNFTVYAANKIAINEINFPDENFRKFICGQLYSSDIATSGEATSGVATSGVATPGFLSYNFDENNDGYLSKSELEKITSMDCSHCNISNLGGIEYFYNLTELQCNYNQLADLNLSENKKLEILDCSHNNLTNIYIYENILYLFLPVLT